MELETPDATLFDEPPRLARAHLALVRVDARERDHHVRVLARRVDHFLVRYATYAHLELGVDREHHEADLALAIVGNRFRNRLALVGLEVLARRIVIGL